MNNNLSLGRGLSGQVILKSPSGDEVIKIQVPGRRRNQGKVQVDEGWYESSRAKRRRQDKRFQRLLSQGWTIATPEGAAKIGEEQKKNTSLVIGTTKSGDQSHGGDHASGEVEDSKNAAKRGKRSRGSRGGQKHRDGRNRQKGSAKRKRIQVQNAGQNGSVAVYSPQPLQVSKAILEEAEASAELLAELAGRSHLKVKRGVTVDVDRLLIALETGDNPLPAIESPDERPKIKILVTPDCTGSTQNWSGLGCAWALHLSRDPDVDVIYYENFNGELRDVEQGKELEELLGSVDVVVYLGDGDGHELCTSYTQQGCTVIGLDSYCANRANPRLKTTRHNSGTMHWVDRVSAKEPETWTRALELATKA